MSAPKKAVFAGKEEDFYDENYVSQVFNDGELTAYQHQRFDIVGLPSPQALLKRTRKGEYNEVVADGREGVQMTGLFLVTEQGKPLVSPEVEKEVRRYAREHGLPVIEIPYEFP